MTINQLECNPGFPPVLENYWYNNTDRCAQTPLNGRSVTDRRRHEHTIIGVQIENVINVAVQPEHRCLMTVDNTFRKLSVSDVKVTVSQAFARID